MRVRKSMILLPFYSKDLTKLAIFHDYKHHLMICSLIRLDEIVFYQIFQDFFTERVIEGNTYDPHDFRSLILDFSASALQNDQWFSKVESTDTINYL